MKNISFLFSFFGAASRIRNSLLINLFRPAPRRFLSLAPCIPVFRLGKMGRVQKCYLEVGFACFPTFFSLYTNHTSFQFVPLPTLVHSLQLVRPSVPSHTTQTYHISPVTHTSAGHLFGTTSHFPCALPFIGHITVLCYFSHHTRAPIARRDHPTCCSPPPSRHLTLTPWLVALPPHPSARPRMRALRLRHCLASELALPFLFEAPDRLACCSSSSCRHRVNTGKTLSRARRT